MWWKDRAADGPSTKQIKERLKDEYSHVSYYKLFDLDELSYQVYTAEQKIVTAVTSGKVQKLLADPEYVYGQMLSLCGRQSVADAILKNMIGKGRAYVSVSDLVSDRNKRRIPKIAKALTDIVYGKDDPFGGQYEDESESAPEEAPYDA